MQGRMPVWKRANWGPRFSVYWITPIREHMERRHWFFNAVQLAAIIGATYCWRHLPPTGYAIGIVAVLAAVMTVHGEMRHGHKVVWMLLIGAFLFIEFRAIDHDRADFAIKFDSIVNGLKTTIE